MKRLTLACMTLFTAFAATGCIIESSSDPISLVYEQCDTEYDCEDVADDCFEVINASAGVSDRICSTYCNRDDDCFDDGVCGDSGVCLEGCFDDLDCDNPYYGCISDTCVPL